VNEVEIFGQDKNPTTADNDSYGNEDNFIREEYSDHYIIEGLEEMSSSEKLGRTYKQLSSIDEEEEELKQVLKI